MYRRRPARGLNAECACDSWWFPKQRMFAMIRVFKCFDAFVAYTMMTKLYCSVDTAGLPNSAWFSHDFFDGHGRHFRLHRHHQQSVRQRQFRNSIFALSNFPERSKEWVYMYLISDALWSSCFFFSCLPFFAVLADYPSTVDIIGVMKITSVGPSESRRWA